MSKDYTQVNTSAGAYHKTGGAAFPKAHVSNHQDDLGMTLRDYFAIQEQQIPSLNQIKKIKWPNDELTRLQIEFRFEQLSIEEQFQIAAKLRYMAADAMIEERGK